jgi:hypothetical protein
MQEVPKGIETLTRHEPLKCFFHGLAINVPEEIVERDRFTMSWI